jgi:hypothetical protein
LGLEETVKVAALLIIVVAFFTFSHRVLRADDIASWQQLQSGSAISLGDACQGFPAENIIQITSLRSTCYGYVQGFLEGLSMLGFEMLKTIGVCAPDGFDGHQVVEYFPKWIQDADQVDLWKEHRRNVLLRAVKNLYPCP